MLVSSISQLFFYIFKIQTAALTTSSTCYRSCLDLEWLHKPGCWVGLSSFTTSRRDHEKSSLYSIQMWPHVDKDLHHHSWQTFVNDFRMISMAPSQNPQQCDTAQHYKCSLWWQIQVDNIHKWNTLILSLVLQVRNVQQWSALTYRMLSVEYWQTYPSSVPLWM